VVNRQRQLPASARGAGGLPRDERGDRREPIFKDENDRQLLVNTLAEACWRTAPTCALECSSYSWASAKSRTPASEVMAVTAGWVSLRSGVIA
jgi:hypothetical protein